MKRFSIAFILVLFVFVTAAVAGPVRANTVADAKVSGVDTGVVLTGNVVKVINDNTFLFSDGTGELLVHSQSGKLDRTTLAKSSVEVTGKITQNFMYTEVNASSISARN